MLQQTQVATVIPYYHRFLRAFPTLRRLAQAPLERVLELWAGLGYYRRARNLHRAAKIVAEKFDGRFPRDYGQARALPGVGDYTARAVLSIAYHLPYAVLDGNVARVVARLLARRGNLDEPRFHRAVEQKLARLLSRRQPGGFNQAVMELGQTVCLPRAPRCLACPLERWCEAHKLGIPEAFPAPRPRRATEPRHLAVAIIFEEEGASARPRINQGRKLTRALAVASLPRVTQRARVAMTRGLDDGLLSDLWNFPSALGSSRAQALERLKEKLSALLPGEVRLGPRLAELRHNITYRSIRVYLYPAKRLGEIAPASLQRRPSHQALRWLPLSRVERVAASKLGKKIAERIRRSEGRLAARPDVSGIAATDNPAPGLQ